MEITYEMRCPECKSSSIWIESNYEDDVIHDDDVIHCDDCFLHLTGKEYKKTQE